MFTSGTAPPSGVKLSCMALYDPVAPFEVVTAASTEPAMPNRVSLPSMLPPGCSADATVSAPRAAIRALPRCSARSHARRPPTKSVNITQKSIQPWRGRPTIRPNVCVKAAGTTAIASSVIRFVSGVGFAKGCAPFALKKPPPLVPRFLMNSSAATGPMGRSWVATGLPLASTVACRSGTLWYALKFSGVPCQTSTRLPTSETGSRTQSRARTRSTQKLPRNLVRSRASPRMKAIPTASPAAPARKFWATSPTTWLK